MDFVHVYIIYFCIFRREYPNLVFGNDEYILCNAERRSMKSHRGPVQIVAVDSAALQGGVVASVSGQAVGAVSYQAATTVVRSPAAVVVSGQAAAVVASVRAAAVVVIG